MGRSEESPPHDSYANPTPRESLKSPRESALDTDDVSELLAAGMAGPGAMGSHGSGLGSPKGSAGSSFSQRFLGQPQMEVTDRIGKNMSLLEVSDMGTGDYRQVRVRVRVRVRLGLGFG